MLQAAGRPPAGDSTGPLPEGRGQPGAGQGHSRRRDQGAGGDAGGWPVATGGPLRRPESGKLHRRTIRLVRILSDLADTSQAALVDRLVLEEAKRTLAGSVQGLLDEVAATEE